MISAADLHKFLMRRNYLFEILCSRLERRHIILIALDEEHGYRKFEPKRSQVALKHGTLDPAQILGGERGPPVPVIPIEQGEIRHEDGPDRADQVEAIGWRERQCLAPFFRNETIGFVGDGLRSDWRQLRKSLRVVDGLCQLLQASDCDLELLLEGRPANDLPYANICIEQIRTLLDDVSSQE